MVELRELDDKTSRDGECDPQRAALNNDLQGATCGGMYYYNIYIMVR